MEQTPAPGNHQATSVSMNLPLLDLLYKWNHPLWDLLCLASFTLRHAFKVHPCGSI